MLREGAARSLASLVDACVHGLVADAILVGAPQVSLGGIADEAGCALIETPDAAAGLSAALKAARRDYVFVLAAGYAVDRSFVEELGDLFAFGNMTRARVLRAEPDSLVTRLTPRLAAPVGIMALKTDIAAASAGEVASLVRKLRAVDLRCKARRAL
jgi:hypothetical protein